MLPFAFLLKEFLTQAEDSWILAPRGEDGFKNAQFSWLLVGFKSKRRCKYLVQGVEKGVDQCKKLSWSNYATLLPCFWGFWFTCKEARSKKEGFGGLKKKKNGELSVRSQLPPSTSHHSARCSVLHPWRDNEHLALPAHYITTTANSPPRSGAIQPLRSREAVSAWWTTLQSLQAKLL